MIKLIEDELVSLLKINVPPTVATYALGEDWYKIEGKPHRTSNYWVIFAGLDRNVSKGISPTSQNTINFNIHISHIDLRSHQTVYTFIELAIIAIHGKISLQANNGTKFKVSKVSPLEWDAKSSAWKATLNVSLDYSDLTNACINMENPYAT